MPLEDLILMPEVDARRALAGQALVFSLLAPVGAYAGCGALRVLRARPVSLPAGDESAARVELVCGYESYRALEDPPA